MWRQIDRFLSTRMLLPWLPVFIAWQVGKPGLLTPGLFGALATVLGARLIVDGAFNGVLQICFGIFPLLSGAVVCSGASGNPMAFGLVCYVTAGLGTTLAAVSDLRGRR